MIDFERLEQLRKEHSEKEKVRVDYFYIHYGSGNGDLLYNTCREIIDRDDHDEWSHRALEKVFECLEQGIRWPDHMIPYIPAANHRAQDDMTQDPWIMAYCCAVHLKRFDLIKDYRPSIRLFNLPDKWAWRRALLGGCDTYQIWRYITPHNWMQDFVYVFYGYMDKAYLKVKG